MSEQVCEACNLELHSCECGHSTNKETSAYEKLYRAQCEENERIHAKMRELEVQLTYVRGTNTALGAENLRLVEFMKTIFEKFVKEFTS